MRVLIFGGTGFIGASLCRHLSRRGYEPIQVARHAPRSSPFRFLKWDGYTVGPWAEELEGAVAIVNLAGKSVNCRKTPDNIDVILRSRVDSCRVIGEALRGVDNPPPVWVQMSTAHIYGDPARTLGEGDTFGYGLAPFVGKAWEAALLTALPDGMREVRLRTSFVIGRGGGALAELHRLARFGLGGRAGSGRQGMSWLHESDMNALIRTAIEDPTYAGAYIATAPDPRSQVDFMRTLRRVIGMPIGLPAPDALIRLGARWVMDTDPELILYGRYLKSERLAAAGFPFAFPELEAALRDLLR